VLLLPALFFNRTGTFRAERPGRLVFPAVAPDQAPASREPIDRLAVRDRLAAVLAIHPLRIAYRPETGQVLIRNARP
jgi:hypothetical protein